MHVYTRTRTLARLYTCVNISGRRRPETRRRAFTRADVVDDVVVSWLTSCQSVQVQSVASQDALSVTYCVVASVGAVAKCVRVRFSAYVCEFMCIVLRFRFACESCAQPMSVPQS